MPCPLRIDSRRRASALHVGHPARIHVNERHRSTKYAVPPNRFLIGSVHRLTKFKRSTVLVRTARAGGRGCGLDMCLMAWRAWRRTAHVMVIWRIQDGGTAVHQVLALVLVVVSTRLIEGAHSLASSQHHQQQPQGLAAAMHLWGIPHEPYAVCPYDPFDKLGQMQDASLEHQQQCVAIDFVYSMLSEEAKARFAIERFGLDPFRRVGSYAAYKQQLRNARGCSSTLVSPESSSMHASACAGVPTKAPAPYVFEEHDDIQAKADAIRNATRGAFLAYTFYAFGSDELAPLSRGGVNNFGGMGVTIIDSLSTLYMMDLMEEYALARAWVENQLSFERVGEVVVFETIIRVVGGLASTFQLTGDELFLRKAEELGKLLGFAFHSPSGVPFPLCHLGRRVCYAKTSHNEMIPIAEAGSIQLEFRALSAMSSDPFIQGIRFSADDFFRLVDSYFEAGEVRVDGNVSMSGLLPSKINFRTGRFKSSMHMLGAPSDSYYEYLFKLWVQSGYTERHLFEKFRNVVRDTIRYLLRRSPALGLYYVFELSGGQPITKMDHFSCFFPATLASACSLPFAPLSNAERAEWMELAEMLAETCHEMYSRSPSGLAPEHVLFDTGKRDWVMFGSYEQRPEAIEAFLFLWRTTRNPKYRDWAWSIFERIQQHSRTAEGAYATLSKARSRRPPKADRMHSFLISETFKYLYLMFQPDHVLPMHLFVLNTEAHPLLLQPHGLLPPQAQDASKDGGTSAGSLP
ncbi:Mannosyl-oligosaccharide 1,2-alpha-mannosidase MNS2 [Porphyridium purpureum]|uniref:alpha-1,2-Mannosidase n=1 Tax=Porphyridium purpureum TaxID=35688 RepID=A0A5J4Z712_PORPP|nr:Mannosyl-oligosaccharide 1,2-alpha-mannosidase MNS2 [Porphyridium purpureum]|eukprot:POR5779..scf295_1